MRQENLPGSSPEHGLELKFLTTAGGFEASQNWPALAPRRRNAQRLLTRYYDTENADLEAHGMLLRLRRQGRSHRLALIINRAGASQPAEIEVPASSAAPDLALLGPEIAEKLADILQDRELIPVYETDIRRVTRRIASDSGDVEVAFDSGFIRAAEQESPVREIELKSGDPAELYRLGMSLAATYPVRLGTLAKSQRGSQLRSGAPPAIARAASPLAGNPAIDEAIGALITACMAQFTGNFAAFEAGDAVTAVHQMRVALRRLRAILKLFHRAFPCAEFAELRAKARQIAAALGAARNWDVFLQLLRAGPAAAFPEEPGFAPIFAAAEALRGAAYAQVRDTLAAAETTCFVLAAQAFVARRGWRNAVSAEALSRLAEPARAFAGANLNRLRGNLLKRGKHLQSLAPHERHELRIGLKNLRYAGELFSALFDDGKPLRSVLRAAAKLQDRLGGYNDLITAIDLVGQLEPGPSASYAAGIISGWCRRGAMPDADGLLKAWKKFQATKPVS